MSISARTNRIELRPTIGCVATALVAVVLLFGWMDQVKKTDEMSERVRQLTSVPPAAIPARIFEHTSEDGTSIVHLVVYHPGYSEIYEQKEIRSMGAPLPKWIFASTGAPSVPGDRDHKTCSHERSTQVVLHFANR